MCVWAYGRVFMYAYVYTHTASIHCNSLRKLVRRVSSTLMVNMIACQSHAKVVYLYIY